MPQAKKFEIWRTDFFNHNQKITTFENITELSDDTHFPASAASWDQSLRTMSRPLISWVSTSSPLGRRASDTAAYFFFFSSNMYLNTPSISSSTCLYILFTSTLIWTTVFKLVLSNCLTMLWLIKLENPYLKSKTLSSQFNSFIKSKVLGI